MKTMTVPLVRMGKSRGICLPASLISRHKLADGVTLEERGGEIVLRPKSEPPLKLSWEDTYKEMAASDEDWSDWEAMRDGWDDE